MKRATIQRRYDFEAAHRLPHVPDGHKCKNMHGHSYEMVVQVTGPVQEDGPEAGMVVDFGLPDAVARTLVRKIDHSTLNESLAPNPTVENMAPLVWSHFFDEFATPLGLTNFIDNTTPDNMMRWSLKVWLYEGPRSCAIYPPEE